MDSVLVFGTKGCGFESRRGYSFYLFFYSRAFKRTFDEQSVHGCEVYIGGWDSVWCEACNDMREVT
jgi:hypothetical protein